MQIAYLYLYLFGLTVAGSKRGKGDELPRNGPRSLRRSSSSSSYGEEGTCCRIEPIAPLLAMLLHLLVPHKIPYALLH